MSDEIRRLSDLLAGDPASLAFIPLADALRRGSQPDVALRVVLRGLERHAYHADAHDVAARIYVDMAERGEDFGDFCWSFTDGQVLRGDGRQSLASSELSVRIAKALKQRGFKFVGPVIVYAWMQAVGIVDDHALHCFRRGAPSPHGAA